MDLSPAVLRTAYVEGRVTPVDVVTYVLSKLEDDDQENVWISTVDRVVALASAEALTTRLADLDRLPLFGLPFSVKDNIDVAGAPTTAACPAYGYDADMSAFVVEEALKAGAIYIGKTNLDQFATGLVGVRSPYGTPRNPYNADYIPGGSSSGAGVSVSTGVVSFAFGTDTGGSGRVPASYNGIAGFKPAPGLLSRRGLVFACRSIDTPSVFTKTATDACTVFDAVNAHDPLDAFATAPAIIKTQTSIPNHPKIAVPQQSDLQFFGNAEIEEMFLAATEHARTLFGPVSEIDFTPFTDLNDIMFFGPLLAERDVSVGAFIDENFEAVDPTVRGLVQQSKKMSAADAYRAQYRVLDTKIMTQSVWDQHDILMVPTVGTILTTAELAEDPILPNFKNGFYTNYANPLGLSAIATPFKRTKSGVPWGVTLLVNQSNLSDLAAIADTFSGSVS